jgi:secondary thiamine-phosphate synthase enzyme
LKGTDPWFLIRAGLLERKKVKKTGSFTFEFQFVGVFAMNLWIQKTISLAPRNRGFHLITGEILDSLPELREFQVGFLQIFLQHTSAALTINENADPDVRCDLETASNRICPESLNFRHTCEGPDDMPAHVKASLFGCQLLIPIQRGQLGLGTWQGIYLCEHRNHAGARRLVLTASGNGLSKSPSDPLSD